MKCRAWGYVLVVIVLGTGVACLHRNPAKHPATHRAPLKLASWNLDWLNRAEDGGMVPRTAEDYERLARYAARLDADIVALQEVDGEAAARRVFDPALYAFHFTADEGSTQRTGFAYKRNLRITPNPDFVELAISRTRSGADITVNLDHRQLRVMSIHLKSGCWGEPLTTEAPACDILRAQLLVLEAWIDARASEGIPFAIVGDFNRRFEPPDPFWLEIDDADPPNADLLNVTEGRSSQCWNGEYPKYVDHIVLDKRATAWIVPGSFQQLLYEQGDFSHKAALSDHCPIAASLAVGGMP